MRLVRNVLLGVLALAAFALLAAWTCPAGLLYGWFGARLAPLHLRGIDGTLWHGRAESADVSGQPLGALAWQLSPAALLRGTLQAQLGLSGAVVSGEGRVERSRDGAVTVSDARLRLPARAAAPAFGIPTLDLLGTIEIDIAQARFTGAWPGELRGTARWRDAAVAGAAQAQLGELRAAFASTADGRVHGTVGDAGGPLAVAGVFDAGIAGYRAQVRLAPRGGNAQLAEALQYVGQPQDDGSRELLIEGRQAGIF